MKISVCFMFSAALATLVAVRPAQAYEPSASRLSQPAAVEDIAFDSAMSRSDAGQAGVGSTPSPSDRPPPPETSAAVEAPQAEAASAPALSCPPGPQPWKLPQPCFLQKMGINMGGWVQQGITFNAQHPADGFNGPITTNDLDRQYQMNQAWLYFVRPTKTDGAGIDIGGRIDVVYGTDWRFGQCFGLEPTFDDPNSFYGMVLPQFYLEVAINDLTVKMGHFATLYSYEVVPAPLNFFYSHTFLMSGYFDPLLVTGVEADYKLNDNWTLVGGFNRGWLMFEDMNEKWDYAAGVKWASDDKRSTLSVMVEAGPQDAAGLNDRVDIISVFTRKLSQRLQYAAQLTVGYEQDGGFTPLGSDDTWFGIDQWLLYQINPKWSAGARVEWVRDNHGARVFGIGDILGTDKGWQAAPGFAGDFTDLTFGLNYRPHPNFVLRPEVRWDWYQGTRNVDNQLPYGDHTSSHQFTAAMDLIMTF